MYYLKAPYYSDSNGISERLSRIPLDMAILMTVALNFHNLEPFWTEAKDHDK